MKVKKRVPIVPQSEHYSAIEMLLRGIRKDEEIVLTKEVDSKGRLMVSAVLRNQDPAKHVPDHAGGTRHWQSKACLAGPAQDILISEWLRVLAGQVVFINEDSGDLEIEIEVDE